MTAITDTSITAQQARIEAALREGPKTTVELRDKFNIMHPAMRVKELREQGHTILTVRTLEHDHCGRPHRRVARYVLLATAPAISNYGKCTQLAVKGGADERPV